MTVRVKPIIIDDWLTYPNERVFWGTFVPRGDSIGSFNIQLQANSLPLNTAGDPEWMSPHHGLQYNAGAMWIPYTVAVEHRDTLSGLEGLPEDRAQLDNLWKSLLFDQGLEGVDFYHSSNDLNRRDYDPDTGEWHYLTEKGVGSAGDTGDAQESKDPIISYGPQGVQMVDVAYRLVKPSVMEAGAQSAAEVVSGSWPDSPWATLFTDPSAFRTYFVAKFAELFGGDNAVVYQNLTHFKDSISLSTMYPLRGPGYLLIGGWRYNVVGSDNFHFLQTRGTERRRLLSAMATGSERDVKHAIRDRTDTASDWLRNLLYGADIFTSGVPTDLKYSWISRIYDAVAAVDSPAVQNLSKSTFSQAVLNFQGLGSVAIGTKYPETLVDS